MIGTSEDDHIAIGQPFGIVARLINTRSVVINKTFTSHLVEVIIASGHTPTSNIEFANYADRQFVAVAVDDKLLDIQLRLAHSNQLGIRQFCIIRSHCNFRRPVAIEDTSLGNTAHLLQEGITELLTTRTTDLHLGYGLAEVITGEPGLPTGRRTRHHINMLLQNEPRQFEWVIGLFLCSHDKGLTIEESHTDVL